MRKTVAGAKAGGSGSGPNGISKLGYALLGLIRLVPASGYDLRRMFATTPMGTFSDSPGAIYPALARLERQGFIQGRVEQNGLRQRRVFRVTGAGSSRLERWLAEPIRSENVVHGMDELMLRFAFMDRVAGTEASQAFLRALQSELRQYVRNLRSYMENHKGEMPISGMLALESGIRAYEAHLKWAEYGLQVYARARTGGTR
jgi:DNA-binding PadR family transcriptional regulator